MKYRKDFVTNSSSSSFTCEICGRTTSGWDMSLSEAGMVECVNGHTFCQHEMLKEVSKDDLIRMLLDFDDYDLPSKDEMDAMDADELEDLYLEFDGDFYYAMPEEFCPICQFIEYSQADLANYLEKKYGVSRADVFAIVKQANKRRRKLYDAEYVTEVCRRYNLNPTEIVAGWKQEFGTYDAFSKYLSERETV